MIIDREGTRIRLLTPGTFGRVIEESTSVESNLLFAILEKLEEIKCCIDVETAAKEAK